MIPVMNKNILQWVIGEDHHSNLKQDELLNQEQKAEVGVKKKKCVHAVYLVVIECIHERYESPGLSFLVQRQQRNVSNKDSVKQPGNLQVVTGP